MSDFATKGLKEAQRALVKRPLTAPLVLALQRASQQIQRDLRDTIVAEIAAFSVSANPEVMPDLARHGAEHIEEIRRLLLGGAVRNFEFVSEHANRRAAQRFPLEATLHAYRCGHKVFSRWLRDSVKSSGLNPQDASQVLGELADFTLEYTDAISTVAAASYVAQTRLLADVAGDQRAQLINILLEGHDEADGRVAKILRQAGFLDQRQAFCVVLARAVDPAEMLNPARARRVAEAVEAVLTRLAGRHVVDVRDDCVTVIRSALRRTSGWTAPNTELSDRLSQALMAVGNAVLIGVSNDVPSTSQIPTAHQQAKLALELASVADRVVSFSKIAARRLLIHLGAEQLRRVQPPWVAGFIEADRKLKGSLLATVSAYGSANMNVLKAAESLSVHPNTIYARFQKIQELSGADPRDFHDLCELLLIMDCWSVQE